MALPQQSYGLSGSNRNCSTRSRGEENVVQPIGTADALHCRGVRHGDEVVLVGAAGGRTLRLENTNYAARHSVDADALSNWIFVRKEILEHCLPEHAYGNVLLYIVMSEDCAALQFPSSNIKIFWSHSAICRIPVVCAVDHLHSPVDVWAHPP